MAKDNTQHTQLHQVCSTVINAFYYSSIYLKPIIPTLIADIENFLNISALTWDDLDKQLLDHIINPYTHLATRIDSAMLDNLIKPENSILETNTQAKTEPAQAAALNTTSGTNYEPIAETINIDDFSKLDLRIAKIIDAKQVEGADKLLQLTLDIGFETRQVFAGIKSAYTPEDLINKYTVMVANLAPRKMKFGMSEGMVLAASFADNKAGGLYILEPHAGAKPGRRVR
jgi:methionyl-tRNA synthetase